MLEFILHVCFDYSRMKKNNINNTVDESQLLWLRHFSAGICAGGASRTCTAPIDRLRTFFQGN